MGMKRKRYIIIIIVIVILISIGGYLIFDDYKKNEILDSIVLQFDDELNEVEYGTQDFDTKILVKKVEGKIEKYPDLNTMEVGKKSLVFVVTKDSQKKEFTKTIEIVDTKKPEIRLKEENPIIDIDAQYDVLSNIESVSDPVDGVIEYISKEELDELSEKKRANYYTVSGVIDTSVVDDYEIKVLAVDKNGNSMESVFKVSVKQRENDTENNNQQDAGKPESENQANNNPTNENQNIPVQTKGSIQDVINTALNQIGKPYVTGGRGPDSFDCDGLVLYAFVQNGYSMASSGAYSGYSVGNTLDVAQPGDIIYTENHVSIYLGDGKVIEAVSSAGVRISDRYLYGEPGAWKFLDIRRVR
ncbi:NlpC/P60 family protein [Breznakia pachnodae]|uniref:Cell wall-associated NlpC family hydrolase n=1 Tax=Breznakia pachnodae TaxID=265178 RepID=A0ABU0E3N3_9FIRM|nr:NlpC/P60 family protein [Breznakia pachnodae]MDQ0361495.1 cell wall-associated NlpC family hydrolase [Breznakia pachnodae]